MTAAFDPKQPVRRDQWGRYMVLPPGGKKPTGYTRATTVAKALDDTSNLSDWACRMTAIGLAARPDLVALVTAVADDKRELNKLCERAKEAGGATVRRDLGTALHAMIEQSFTVADYVPPAAHAADVRAVHEALRAAGFTVVDGLHEQMVVLDEHRIAGTFDLVLERDGQQMVADVKSGSNITYGALGFAVQLAIYANANALYRQGGAADGSEDVRSPMPNVSREAAVIVHVEPGSGACTLHHLDIAGGAEALQLAVTVREWRKKKLLTPIESATPLVDSMRAHLVERVETLRAMSGGLEALAAVWPAGVPTLKQSTSHTADEAKLIMAALDDAERRVHAPFPSTDDPTIVRPELLPYVPAVRTTVRTAPDEGGPVDQADLDLMRNQITANEAWLALGRQWAAEANTAGGSINLSVPTRRRHAIGRILLFAVEFGEDIMRAFIAHIVGTDEALFPSTPFGAVLGTLGVDDAEAVADLSLRKVALGVRDDGIAYVLTVA